MAEILIPEVKETPPSAARVAAVDLLKDRRELAVAIVEGQRRLFDRLWKSPDAKPEDILRELGTDASAFFTEGGLLVEFLMATKTVRLSEADYAPPVAYTAHDDGTVTLN